MESKFFQVEVVPSSCMDYKYRILKDLVKIFRKLIAILLSLNQTQIWKIYFSVDSFTFSEINAFIT